MSETSKAIFLSYARDDVAAARRIAEALRSAGLEVWFDENELRGGDTWDAKIRTQIDACALFVPVISAHTQERTKGYFRLEWKLAVDQTHLLAAGVPFIAPVVIDDTREAAAVVPPEFMKVQWSRLPGALPTPEFVGQVKRLLSGEQGAGSKEPGRSRPAVAGFGEAGPGSTTPATKRGIPGWTWGALTAVAVGVAAALGMFRKAEPVAAPQPVPVIETKLAPAAPPRISDKSIAVLPFTNMSEEKDSAFFTDGMHEDILTNLALVRELRVVSRTSVMPYRKTEKSMRQIAQELGVTYILEGSVRRSGNKVRVTGQLIHAASDEHVWAASYDRDLTDVFTIQAELSQQIAGALKAALSPEEKVLIARKPTENPAAYDLFLRARDVTNRRGISTGTTNERILLLKSAVELDPNFSQAWGDLADAYAYAGFTFEPGMDEMLALAKIAMDRAVQRAPDDPDVIRSLGTYYYYGFRDYARATEQYQRLARQQPNDPTVFFSLGLIQRRQGDWAKALANLRRAADLDPANLRILRALVSTLSASNRYPELEVAQRRLVALLPDRLLEGLNLAAIPFFARGSAREMDAFIAHLTPEQAASAEGIQVRKIWARTRGDWAEAVRLDKVTPYFDEDGASHEEQAAFAALDYFAAGDKAAGKERLGNFPQQLRNRVQAEPNNVRAWSFLASMEAMVGNNAEARRCSDRAVALMPLSLDALDGGTYAIFQAFISDYTGEKERALQQYAALMRVPSPFGFLNVHVMRNAFSTLHGDPRFEALLNDPANNAPLF